MADSLPQADASQDSEVPPHTKLNERISRVGNRLATDLGRFVDSVPGGPYTPQRLAQTLGINKDLSHRVVTALRGRDALATAYQIPGPEPLRRLVKAGVAKGASPELAAEAEEAIRDFDQLIREEVGDRSGLDAIISAWLPDARAKFENTAKQWVYRGARQIKGISADVVFMTMMLHTVPNSPRLDMVMLRGYLGLRCVRPGAQLKLGVRSGVSEPSALPLTLDDEPARDLHGVLLEQYCTGERVKLHTIEKGQDIVYTLQWGDQVGLHSARDIVMAELRRRAPRRHMIPEESKPKTGVMHEMVVPAKLCICDVILGDGVYPDWEPQVRVLETGEAGWADPNDATRDLDVLDVMERIEPLGSGVERFRATEIPRYVDILKHVCNKLGWNGGDFRAYRTKIEYPIFGSQVQFAFDVPPAPAPPAE